MSGLFDLQGRVAAVIGGTGVLGGVLCQGLADAGASVAVLGRSRERGEARAAALTGGGGRATAVVVDAT
ncbi:MAG TPA: D-mannonate oxidoreductase, partial [Coriobacteriia bacterium]